MSEKNTNNPVNQEKKTARPRVSAVLDVTVEKIFEETGVSGICDIKLNYIPLVNHDRPTKIIREVIKETLGEEYLFPLLGYWESFDDIDLAFAGE